MPRVREAVTVAGARRGGGAGAVRGLADAGDPTVRARVAVASGAVGRLRTLVATGGLCIGDRRADDNDGDTSGRDDGHNDRRAKHMVCDEFPTVYRFRSSAVSISLVHLLDKGCAALKPENCALLAVV